MEHAADDGAVAAVVAATWVEAAHAATLLADADDSTDDAILSYFDALDIGWDNECVGMVEAHDLPIDTLPIDAMLANATAHESAPLAIVPAKRVLEPASASAPPPACLPRLDGAGPSGSSGSPLDTPMLDALPDPAWSYLLQSTGIDGVDLERLLQRAAAYVGPLLSQPRGIVEEALRIFDREHGLRAVPDVLQGLAMVALGEAAAGDEAAETVAEAWRDGAGVLCHGDVIRTPAGDTLYFNPAHSGVALEVGIAASVAHTAVRVRLPCWGAPAGYPFRFGYTLDEALLCIWPFGFPGGPGGAGGDHDGLCGSGSTTAQDVWLQVERMRDMRLAAAAGDDAAYARLLHGGDGRSAVAIEAAHEAAAAADPIVFAAWAAWRDENDADVVIAVRGDDSDADSDVASAGASDQFDDDDDAARG